MPPRKLLLRTAANDVGLPPAFAKFLAAERPRLGAEKVNEDFGLDLLAEHDIEGGVSRAKTEQRLYALDAGLNAQALKWRPTLPSSGPRKGRCALCAAAHVQR